MRETIQRLLQTDLSSNHIATKTGVSQSVISRIRSGNRELGKINLDSAERLYNYQKGIEKMNEIKKYLEENYKLINTTVNGNKEYDLNKYKARVIDWGDVIEIDIYYKSHGKLVESLEITEKSSQDDIDFVKMMIKGKSEM